MRYSKAQIELAKKRQELKTYEAAYSILDMHTRLATKIWDKRRNTARIKREREQNDGYAAWCDSELNPLNNSFSCS